MKKQYNLKKDVGEQNNLAGLYAEMVAKLGNMPKGHHRYSNEFSFPGQE